MNKIAQVVELKTGGAVVAFNKHAACGECGACQVGEENMASKVEVINPLGAKVGDFVEIELADSDVLGAAFTMYIVPLIAMFIAMGITQVLLKSIMLQMAEVISAVVGFAVVGLVYIFIRRKYEREHVRKRYVSIITRVLDDGEQSCEIISKN